MFNIPYGQLQTRSHCAVDQFNVDKGRAIMELQNDKLWGQKYPFITNWPQCQ